MLVHLIMRLLVKEAYFYLIQFYSLWDRIENKKVFCILILIYKANLDRIHK